MSMLSIKDLQVYYGAINAIKGISFDVEQGEIIALIGANGAGKTTILTPSPDLFRQSTVPLCSAVRISPRPPRTR